jgi:poly-gamma-glutamate synthesis protein (capsule biosynthesis protein)
MHKLFFFCFLSVVSKLFGQYDTLYFTSTDSMSTVKFSAVGDLMCHGTQLEFARLDSTTFDFKSNFEKVKTIFEESDVVMGNLETVVAGKDKGYLGYPVFNTPIEYLEALEFAGFDLLITANNHATDQGREGILNTARNIKMSNMIYSGTNISRYEKNKINVFTVKDISFAVLSYTYGVNLNNLEDDDLYMVNFIDTVQIRRDIIRARNNNAEIVIVFFHFGKEYANEPNQYQLDVVNRSINYGADIIIGSHPHTLQPVEFYKTKNAKIDSGFVAYSLGNFISNQRWRY